MKRDHSEPTAEETSQSGAETVAQTSAKKESPQKAAETPLQTREQELTSQLQRLQAEFENYRKRVDAEGQQAGQKGQEKLLKDLLTVVDSLDLALKHNTALTETNPAFTELRQAMLLIHNQLSQFLEQHAVERIPTTGVVDPRLHEVYTTETADAPAGTILETFQSGFRRNGTVLRTAKVKAARNE